MYRSALLPTDLAALACGVKPITIRLWVHRGFLTAVGGTPRRPLYNIADLDDAALRASRARYNTPAVNAA